MFKRSFFVITVLVLSIVSTSHAGGIMNGWIYQYPYPTSQGLYEVKFVTPQKGWMVGKYGTIFHTEDNGNTWIAQQSGSEEDLARLFFVNENTGWAAGVRGALIHTEDGGKTWNIQYNTHSFITKIFFINEKEGWLTTSNPSKNIISTRDGGRTWQRMNVGIARAIASVYFINSQTGWILAGEDVYRTIDGGAKWQKSKLPIGQLPPRRKSRPMNMLIPGESMEEEGLGSDWGAGDIVFMNEKQGNAVVLTWIFHTEDGGKTWTMQFDTTNFDYGLGKMSFRDAQNGCVAGWTIYCTENGGKTWQERLGSSPPDDNLLGGISLVGRVDGWAVGEMGRIYKTTDNGRRWVDADNVKSCGKEVFFVNRSVGWGYAPTGYNYFCRTDDGGRSWMRQDVDMLVSDVFFIDDSRGWAVGSIGESKDSKKTSSFSADLIKVWGLIKYTTDGGETWVTQHKESMGKDQYRGFSKVHFINSKIGWVVGRNGIILHTEDAGKRWMRQQSGIKYHLLSVYFTDDQTGVAIGDRRVALGEDSEADRKAKGIILYTSDGGKHWRVVWEKIPVLMSGISFSGKGAAWATVETLNGPLLLYSQDGGKTWNEKSNLKNYPTYTAAPYFADKERGLLILQSYDFPDIKEVILKTVDGGISWRKIERPLSKYPFPITELIHSTDEK